MRTAQRLLRERALKKEQDRNDIVNRIQTLLAENKEQPAFSEIYQTMWLQYAINYPSGDSVESADDTAIVNWLENDNEHVRATVVKVLSDRPSQSLPQGSMQRLLDLAANDNSSLCLLYTSPSPRDQRGSRMPSSA